MGVGAADVAGRLAASVGELDAVAPDFTPALDVPNGGLLCALPALLAVGLLDGVERHLQLPKGYYGLDSLLLLLAFMALARLESIESLRYCAPGEWGKLLGLDRVPEVRTLRRKIALLAQEDAPGQWSAALCERWMAAAPEQAGVLTIGERRWEIEPQVSLGAAQGVVIPSRADFVYYPVGAAAHDSSIESRAAHR
jgi:hypothetical protein